MIGRLIEIGSYCGKEMNVEKVKVMGISRQLSPVQITVNKKQLENVGCKV
jgi:Fe2+ transport system protein FeoA